MLRQIMKLILSRKGMDSGAGKAASPIFPDGRMLSLPIPERGTSVRYQDILGLDGQSIGPLVEDLTGGRIPPHFQAHLDPDLRRKSLERADGWRPAFGQVAAAQGHLRNNGVGPGDLFLFFGRFRPVDLLDRRYRYVPGSKPIHCLFGWLQIGARLSVNELDEDTRAWASRHPHVELPDRTSNTIYLASDRLTEEGAGDRVPAGGGVFPTYDSRLRLTAPDSKGCSIWKLPRWFHPEGRDSTLTYHGKESSWSKVDDGVLLQSVAKGQEFALDCDHYPEAVDWAHGVILGSSGSGSHN